jgi:hypothetical protein
MHIWNESDTPPGPHPQYPGTCDTLSDPSEYSACLESWHNDVHNNTVSAGGEYDDRFSDRAQNIFMPMFWWWHSLIDDMFMSWLSKNGISFDDLDHVVV